MKFFIFILSLLSNFVGVEIEQNSLKTSIIIPCCAQHARHLYGLVKEFEAQTVLPDEVVISLSESNKVKREIINALQEESWKFPLVLILSEKKMFAGENRNVACSHATGDIFICQDADDIPHPKRVEIIIYFFQNYNVDHLIHGWFRVLENETASFGQYENLDDIPSFFPSKFKEEVWSRARLTQGNVALARHVFDEIKWTSQQRGQDTLFNAQVYEHFQGNCIVINASLLEYRMFLSSAPKAKKNYASEQFWRRRRRDQSQRSGRVR